MIKRKAISMSDVISPTKKKRSRSKKFENLIGPTDPKVDNDARERLITSRISLLLKHSFFGNLATRLKLINADEWCTTAATDGVNFYYNSRFIMMLRPKEVDFLVGHEVLHVVYDHMGRRDHRDPEIWNIADDYAVNADLKRHKIGEFITTVPALYEAKYDGKPAEEIYEDLMKNVQYINIDDLLDKMLDDHIDGDGDGDDDEGGEGNGDKKGKGRPKLSEAEKEQIRQEVKQSIINAAQQADAGSVPAGVQRLIKQMTDPVMPWRELIQTNLTSAIKSDYSWMRPSRRGWHMDAIMPGMNPGEEIDVTVMIDMSGSISTKQGMQFISEVAGMMDIFDGFKIHIACFDTKVYNPRDYTSENLDTIDDYELAGGGGTDFDCIFQYLKDEAIVPNRLIVFTDGYPFGSWGDADYCDTTWIIHGDPNPNPPFGTFALYDDHRKS
jgi:predicted metal-dependent peptidase